MKAYLLHTDRDLDPAEGEPVNADELAQDLELDTLWDAMAGGDELVRKISRTVILTGLTDPAEIIYRQHVLSDALHQPGLVTALYDLAGQAIAAERGVFRGFFADNPESLLQQSVQVLELFLDSLKQLRRFADDSAHEFRSEGFARFFTMVAAELDDEYFREIDQHLKQLTFRSGLLLSARLGQGNQGIDFVLRQPREENRSFFNRIGLKKPTYSYTIPAPDEGGLRSLAELRDQGLNEVANAAAQSCDHVLSFFHALRAELAFFIGCTNLHARLAAVRAHVSYPKPQPRGSQALATQSLYDVCLALRLGTPVVGNSVTADGKALLMVTGANRGGKSTFLRSVGLAHLMMAAGMFVAADAFTASTPTSIFTHFAREEDEGMVSGKFDEELVRMSAIVDHLDAGSLLLCNESFASTNEREGSEIARQVIRAMIDTGIRVVFVTHMFDLAHSLYDEKLPTALFLRAERHTDGERTFRVVEGEPLPTSYGQDLYAAVFGKPLPTARSAFVATDVHRR